MLKLFLSVMFCAITSAHALQYRPPSITRAEADSRYVNITGDTMTGPLTVSGASVTISGDFGVGGISSLVGLVATGSTITVGSGMYIAPNASAFPSSTYDAYALLLKTAGGGSAPFDQAGSLIYRTRLSDTAGRSSHIFYTGATALERMRINEAGTVSVVNGMTVDTASNTLVVDSVNHRAGILTGTPSTELEVNGTSTLGRNSNALVYPLIVKNNSTGGSADVALQFATGGGAPYLRAHRDQSAAAYGGISIHASGGTEIARFTRGGEVGISSTTPTSKLTVQGPIATAFATKTTTYTVTATDSVIKADATGGAFTITLPTAVGCAGRVYTIKKVDAANNIIVDGDGSETIDGADDYTLSTQWQSIKLVSDGANWLLI